MNYAKKAQEIREAMIPVREQAGRWLIASLYKSIERGEMLFRIPSGTYIIYEPIPIANGMEVRGSGTDCVLQVGCIPYWKNVNPSEQQDYWRGGTISGVKQWTN
jgi:hypothetical protein